MREILSHHDILSLIRVRKIGGDLLFLPSQRMLRPSNYLSLVERGRLSVEELVELFTGPKNRSYYDYQAYRTRHQREPRWIREMSNTFKAEVRGKFAICELDPLAIVNILPNTGISYMVTEGGLCGKLFYMFNLWRLQGIRQLGFLQAPWFAIAGTSTGSPIAEHRRYSHSLDVMAIASLIGYNNQLPGHLLNTLRAAALTHDMGTPAGGDSVKLVDLPALDEDANYQRLLSLVPERKALFAKYRISERRLVATIHNQGVLGQILDIADKLAYVARDLHECESYFRFGAKHLNHEGLGLIIKHLDQVRYPCSLWDSVVVEGDKVVITDPRKLAVFLRLRTLMFRELYMHPNARFGEWLTSRVLVKALYQQGKLTRDELLSMSDEKLQRRLNQEFDSRRAWSPHSIVDRISEHADSRGFQNIEEAEMFRQELLQQGNPFVLVEDNRRAIKTGTHFLVRTKKGPRPFSEAFPRETRQIEKMAILTPPIQVYFLREHPDISREKLAEILASIRS